MLADQTQYRALCAAYTKTILLLRTAAEDQSNKHTRAQSKIEK